MCAKFYVTNWTIGPNIEVFFLIELSCLNNASILCSHTNFILNHSSGWLPSWSYCLSSGLGIFCRRWTRRLLLSLFISFPPLVLCLIFAHKLFKTDFCSFLMFRIHRKCFFNAAGVFPKRVFLNSVEWKMLEPPQEQQEYQDDPFTFDTRKDWPRKEGQERKTDQEYFLTWLLDDP